MYYVVIFFFFFFQAEDGIRDYKVTGVQTCALPISFSGRYPPESTISGSSGNRLSSGAAGSLDVAKLQSIDDLVEHLGLFGSAPALRLFPEEHEHVDQLGRLSKIALGLSAAGIRHPFEGGGSDTSQHHEQPDEAPSPSCCRLGRRNRLGWRHRLGWRNRPRGRGRLVGAPAAVTDAKSLVGFVLAHHRLRSIRRKSLLYNRMT